MSNANDMMVRAITTNLPRWQYSAGSEDQVQRGIAEVLDAAGIDYRREVVAGSGDRFDFLIGDGLVIEAKTAGSLASALLQCARYVERADVYAVVLASTSHWAANRKPVLHAGKSIHIVRLPIRAF